MSPDNNGVMTSWVPVIQMVAQIMSLSELNVLFDESFIFILSYIFEFTARVKEAKLSLSFQRTMLLD